VAEAFAMKPGQTLVGVVIPRYIGKLPNTGTSNETPGHVENTVPAVVSGELSESSQETQRGVQNREGFPWGSWLDGSR